MSACGFHRVCFFPASSHTAFLGSVKVNGALVREVHTHKGDKLPSSLLNIGWVTV